MAASRVLKVEIVGDSGSLNRALGRSEQRLTRFGKVSNRVSGRVSGGFKNAARGAAGLAVGFAGIAGAKKAISTTEELAKTTLSLNKNLGLSVGTASKFGAVLKARGVDTKQVNMAFGTFSKQVEAAKKGTASASDAFEQLGVSQGAVAKSDPYVLIQRVADGMKRLGPGTDRTAIAMKLFGRGWQSLGPLLRDGSGALNDQLALAEKYGATFSGKSVKGVQDLIAAQREAKLASMGLQIAFGTQVAPALTKVINGIAQFVANLRAGRGVAGQFGAVAATAFNAVKTAVGAVSSYLRQNEGTIRSVGRAFADIGLAAKAAFDLLIPIVRRVWPGIRQIIQGALRIIGGIIKVFSGVLTGDFGKAWSGVKQIFSGALKSIGGMIRAATAPFRAAFEAVTAPIKTVFIAAFTAARRAVGAAVSFVLRRMDDVLGGFSSIMSAGSKIPVIGGMFRRAAGGIDKARERLRATADALEGVRKKKDTKVNVRLQIKSFWDKPSGGSGQKAIGGPGDVQGSITQAVRDQAQGRRPPAGLIRGLGGLGVPGRASGALGTVEGIGHRMGLYTSSGYRPGDDGWHGRNRARDLSGPAGRMMAFARRMYAQFGGRLLELIYTPMGVGIKNGRSVNVRGFYGPSVAADHFDHVHVAMAKGGQRGGKLTAPTVLAGEEAPTHPEFFISTNPRDRARSMGLLVQAAKEVMGRRLKFFARGGIRGVASAARSAGFKGGALRTAIAVAMAESGGNPRAHGDRSLGGSYGLWQVHHPSHPQYPIAKLLNARYNARAAYQISGGGRNWGPWTTFRTGAYRQFLDDADSAIKGLGKVGGRNARRRAKKRGKGKASGGMSRAAQRLQAQLEAQLAMAGVTPGGADDLAAQTRLTGFLGGQYREALASRSPARIREAADAYRGGLDALQSLREEGAGDTGAADASQALQDAVTAAAEEMRRVADEIAGMRSELAKQNAFARSVAAVTSFEAVRALSDVISGQLGGLAAHRGLTAGDGSTLALT